MFNGRCAGIHIGQTCGSWRTQTLGSHSGQDFSLKIVSKGLTKPKKKKENATKQFSTAYGNMFVKQLIRILIFGDRAQYVSCLLVPDAAALREGFQHLYYSLRYS